MAQMKLLLLSVVATTSLLNVISALSCLCTDDICKLETDSRVATLEGNDWTCERHFEVCSQVPIPCQEPVGCTETSPAICCGCLRCSSKVDEECGDWVGECESHLECVTKENDQYPKLGVCKPKPVPYHSKRVGRF